MSMVQASAKPYSSRHYKKILNASDDEIRVIWGKAKQMCRENRIERKITENQHKDPHNTLFLSSDILNAADFTFTPFVQRRGMGDSGNLLLAVNKYDSTQRYIVKHAFCDCAANEYIYSKIAQAIGLKMPDVKLFYLENPLDNTLFDTEYIVGIEYLNIVEKHPSAKTRETSRNPDDYYKFNTLYELFLESDRFETALADDGYIYRFDTTAAFLFNDNLILAMSTSFNPLDITQYAERVVPGQWSVSKLDAMMKRLIERNGEDKAEILLDPLYWLKLVPKSYIDRFLETLCYFYPDSVGDYYRRFLFEMQESLERYTELISENSISNVKFFEGILY